MSRYTFEVTEKKLHIVVGWDNPLQTFFLQIRKLNDNGRLGKMIKWTGTSPNEIKTVDELIIQLISIADIPPDIAKKLANDHESATEPTALQKQMTSFIKRS